MNRTASPYKPVSASQDVSLARTDLFTAADRWRLAELNDIARRHPGAILGVVSYWLTPRRRNS